MRPLFLFLKETSDLRYHHKEPKNRRVSTYGELYFCDHPAYSRCTLYRLGDKGLAVIRQRYFAGTKTTAWRELDGELADEIFLHPGFKAFFEERAGEPENGCYPTVTARQIMWALRMKPLQKERWETVFDRKDI